MPLPPIQWPAQAPSQQLFCFIIMTHQKHLLTAHGSEVDAWATMQCTHAFDCKVKSTAAANVCSCRPTSTSWSSAMSTPANPRPPVTSSTSSAASTSASSVRAQARTRHMPTPSYDTCRRT